MGKMAEPQEPPVSYERKLEKLQNERVAAERRLAWRRREIVELLGKVSYQILEENIHPETDAVSCNLELITMYGAARLNELAHLKSIEAEIDALFESNAAEIARQSFD